MKTNLKCIECSLSNFFELLYAYDIDEQVREEQTREILRFLADLDYSITPPQIAKRTHSRIKKLIGVDDLYHDKKTWFNHRILEKYDFFSNKVRQSMDPILTAATLAIGGNIIDFSPKVRVDMEEAIENILQTPLRVNHMDKLIQDLKRAELILYLTDNTGEIVFDKLLIQTLMDYGVIKREKIIVATRGYPIINDATLEDAEEVGMTDIVRVIGNGDDTPGTVLEAASDEFRELFHKADVILSKGQGNFETLDHIKNKNIFFMLIAKCEVIAGRLGVNIGDFICKNA